MAPSTGSTEPCAGPMLGSMRQRLHSNERPGTGTFSLNSGPRTLTMLWSSAGVGVAYVLGVEWLSTPLLAVPAGLWLVAGFLALAELQLRGVTERWARRFTGGSLRMSLPNLTGGWSWPRGLSGRELRASVNDWFALPARDHTAKRFNWRSASLPGRIGIGSVDGVQTVRIGVDLTDREFAVLAPPSGGPVWLNPEVRVKWVRVPAGQFSSSREELSKANGLDALVRRKSGGSVFVFFNERSDRPAAWLDWMAELPLSYPGVFPSRFDASQVELAGWCPHDPVQSAVARELVTVGAVLSRTAARVKPTRILKDRTLDGPEVPGGASDQAMQSLARAFLDFARRPFPPAADSGSTEGLVHAAGRLLAVWASTNESTLGAGERESILIAASEGLEHEPVQILRLAAAQVAAGQDEQGIRSLLWARRRLRSAGAECVSEPMAFVQSEIELGRPGGLSIGRIAAGLTLLWATCPADRIDYLRDDVTDDLRHSGWLSGREQDLAMIERVMDELERAERNDVAAPRSMAA